MPLILIDMDRIQLVSYDDCITLIADYNFGVGKNANHVQTVASKNNLIYRSKNSQN